MSHFGKFPRLLVAVGMAVGAFNCEVAQADDAAAKSKTPTATPKAPATPAVAHAKFAYVGSRSCASTACHGSVAPDSNPRAAVQRNEYIHWFENDPHARAYETLRNESSRQIMRNRAAGKQIAAATEDSLCLKCHDPVSQSPNRPEFYSAEGVGCESCHGPAENWQATHFRTAFNRTAAVTSGMIDTKNISARAALCARCHVGSADAEVNHDLIAAGHPPLRFELTGYHDLLPKHWREKKKLSERELWLRGQVASAQAAIGLLQHRARTDAVWPEFAEYDCFACHHDLLTPPTWRQKEKLVDASANKVTMPWGRWYFSSLVSSLQDSSVDDEKDAGNLIADLRALMQSGINVDTEEVVSQAGEVSDDLSKVSKSMDFKTASQRSLDHIADDSRNDVVANWDKAAQSYLLLFAAAKDRGLLIGDDSVANDLKNLRRQLAFPAGSNSPREFLGISKDEDSGTSRSAALELFRSLSERIRQSEEETDE